MSTVRAGRANPSSLDGVMCEYYGVMTPLKQLSIISVPEGNQLLIKPFDKSALGAIEKAIIAANLGYNPSNDGETIRIIVPALTEERRKETGWSSHTDLPKSGRQNEICYGNQGKYT